MAAYKALTLVERIFLYKRCGINSKDFSAYQEWVNIPGLLTEKDIAPMLKVCNQTREELNLALQPLSDTEIISIEDEVNSLDWVIHLKTLMNQYTEEFDARTMQEMSEARGELDLGQALAPFLFWAKQEISSKLGEFKNISISEEVIQKILESIAELLLGLSIKTLVWEFHCYKNSSVTSLDSDEDSCFKKFVRDKLFSVKYLTELYERYPVIARRLCTKCKQLTNHYLELFRRLDKDFFEICDVLDLDPVVNGLSGIEPSQGDTHQQGRSVAIICMGDKRIVYKPRNLEVGKQFNKFIEFLNREAGLLDFYVIKAVYKEKYTFEEYIEYDMCEDAEQIKNYYQRFGQFCAVVFILAGTDIHYENVIAHSEYPVIVDIETLFQHQPLELFEIPENAEIKAQADNFTSVEGTHLLPMVMYKREGCDIGVDLSALSGEEQIWPHKVLALTDINTDTMRFDYQEVTLKSADNIPLMDGKKIQFQEYRNYILEGFERMLLFFQERKDQLLANEGEFNKFNGLIIRCVLKATMNYARYIDFSSHPNYSTDMSRLEKMFDNVWATHLKDRRPIQYEVLDMIDGDVPVFFAYTDKNDLITSGGVVIDSFFEETPFEKARKKLKNLDRCVIEKQKVHMMVSLGMYDDICEKRIVQNQRFGLSLSDSFLTSKLAFDQARALADEIISQAIIDKKTNTIAWNNVRENREKTVRSMVPLDASLSNGMFGVLLFYLALKKVSKSEEYDDYISMIFNTIELFSNDNLHEVLLNENSKMLSTLFEVVEFFDISAQMGDRYAYYRAAINSSAEISNQTSDSSLECALRLLSIVMSKGCVEDSLEFGIGGMLLSLIIKQAPNIYKETIAYLASSMVKRKELNGCYCLHSLDVCSDVGLSAGLSGVGLALLVYCLIFANSNLR